MNPLVEQVLTGNIDMEQFLKKLQDDPELQEYIRRLVPEEAKEDPSHVFWKSVSYPSVKRDHFDYYRFIFRMANSDLWASHPDIRIGKYLNIFSLLKKAYLYYYPDIVCTRRYEDVFDVYLDAVGDCFEGPEVCARVEQIILDTMQLSAKSKRVKQARTVLRDVFHIEGSKRPRWIQGPEWPIGSRSPMQFTGQKKAGETVDYTFQDVDTGDIRTIRQYY